MVVVDVTNWILYLVRCGDKPDTFLSRDGLHHVNKKLAPRMTLEEAKEVKKLHDAESKGFPTAVIVAVVDETEEDEK